MCDHTSAQRSRPIRCIAWGLRAGPERERGPDRAHSPFFGLVAHSKAGALGFYLRIQDRPSCGRLGLSRYLGRLLDPAAGDPRYTTPRAIRCKLSRGFFHFRLVLSSIHPLLRRIRWALCSTRNFTCRPPFPGIGWEPRAKSLSYSCKWGMM